MGISPVCPRFGSSNVRFSVTSSSSELYMERGTDLLGLRERVRAPADYGAPFLGRSTS